MKIKKSKFGVTSLLGAVLSVLMVLCVTACQPDETGKTDKEEESGVEIEKYTSPTEDAMRVVSQLPAYIVPYEYNNFGSALVNRLQNKVTTLDEEAMMTLTTMLFHSSQFPNLTENDWVAILVQLLLGRNIIIIEPTIQHFNYFCQVITALYIAMQELEEGRELLEELDVIPGARQSLEAFYDLGTNPSKVEAMFLFDTDKSGVFAEAIAVRGCDFHIVDRMKGVAEVEISHEVVDEEGKSEDIATPNVGTATGAAPSQTITAYSYGLFADTFTKWINDYVYYVAEEEAMRSRGLNIFNSRASETQKLSLEDITSVQKVQYTIMAATPYDVGSLLPVNVSFEICSIYMKSDNSDYYCVYKNVKSYNQLLDCGPSETRKWRQSDNFGEQIDTGDIYNRMWNPYDYYGPFMRDIECRSICHAHDGSFVDSSTEVVDLPNANSIVKLANVSIEKSSPKNSIGSSDKTDGFSYGFDGGLYLAQEPSVNLGFSVSYDSSTTQTIDDLDIVASTANGLPEWKYTGQNLPDTFINLILDYSHSEAPTIMRRECEVDQSWIWRVPNPQGSYRLFDETMVTTSIMYYSTGFFRANAHFANHSTTKRVSFLMIPPPRSEQLWMMNVSPYSDQLNSMLANTHSRFWNKDDHEFRLSDTSDDSRISIEQFLNDFQQDLNSKCHTWKNRGFLGTYTFSYYNVDEVNAQPITFEFVVE